MADSYTLPAGYGLRRLSLPELQTRRTLPDLLNTLLIWEPPRNRGTRKYILGVDVADGLAKDATSDADANAADYSVCTVLRQGTLEEPDEEVAQFVSRTLTPTEFAYRVDAIGHLYTDADGIEALAAIEGNNHGLVVQEVLQLHLGYRNFYRWEYFDVADPAKRWSNKIGWSTTARTRPLLLAHFHHGITTLDPLGRRSLKLNSPFTRAELPDFTTNGALWEAAAARGAHDDALIASAIAYYISWKLQAGEQEPLEERRRRHVEAQSARQLDARTVGLRRDWRNTDVTYDEMSAGISDEDLDDGVSSPSPITYFDEGASS